MANEPKADPVWPDKARVVATIAYGNIYIPRETHAGAVKTLRVAPSGHVRVCEGGAY